MTPQAPSYEACVWACLNNREFMAHYQRLRGEMRLQLPGSPIEAAVDEAVGFDGLGVPEAELHRFFEFVRDYVWAPLLRCPRDT